MSDSGLVSDRYRLVDLLLDTDFGMTLETDSDPNVELDSAHPIELEHPARWLSPRTLMLTTGTRFADPDSPPSGQRELIRELVGAGVSALGYGVGVVTATIPRALIEEANRCHFAVVSIPEDVRFMDVVARVTVGAGTTDLTLMRRTLQMQNHLLDAMTSADPEGELVGRLGQLLRSSVVLYSEYGDVIASSGEAPLHLIRAQLRFRTEQFGFAVGRWSVRAYPISPADQNCWFVVASKRHTLPEPLAATAVEITMRLLNTIERSRHRATAENRSTRASFVRALARGELHDAGSVRDRMEMLGFGREPAVRMLSIAPTKASAHDRWPVQFDTPLQAIEYEIVDLAHTSRLPLLVAQGDNELLAVMPAQSSSVASWTENLNSHLVCGFSGPFDDYTSGPARLHDARCARRAAERAGAVATRFEDTRVSDWMLGGRDEATARRRARDLLAPLSTQPGELLTFLRQFFDNDLDVAATAKQGALHPNTVRYRVKKIEELLSVSLRAPAAISDLYLGLQSLG